MSQNNPMSSWYDVLKSTSLQHSNQHNNFNKTSTSLPEDLSKLEDDSLCDENISPWSTLKIASSFYKWRDSLVYEMPNFISKFDWRSALNKMDGCHLYGQIMTESSVYFGKVIQGNIWGNGICYIKAKGLFLAGQFKCSKLNGLVRGYSINPRTGLELCLICNFKNGLVHSKGWKFLEKGGLLFGKPNEKYEFTGYDIYYVYPDLKTCYGGYFRRGVMTNGRSGRLIAYRMKNGMFEAQFTIDSKLSLSYTAPIKYSDYKDHICTHPLIADPYESNLVEVRYVDPIKGEGLFSKIDIESGFVVAFYFGVTISEDEKDEGETWEEAAYLIFLDAEESDLRFDIPHDAIPLYSYSASLGHKVNHSFKSNCDFSTFLHPRFGLIPSLVTTKFVAKGTELVANYNYMRSDCPDWFKTQAYHE
ncbi:histone-lysine N-methyltransferase SETD7 isoform X1 [Lepeophtheirus salmonis]